MWILFHHFLCPSMFSYSYSFDFYHLRSISIPVIRTNRLKFEAGRGFGLLYSHCSSLRASYNTYNPSMLNQTQYTHIWSNAYISFFYVSLCDELWAFRNIFHFVANKPLVPSTKACFLRWMLGTQRLARISLRDGGNRGEGNRSKAKRRDGGWRNTWKPGVGPIYSVRGLRSTNDRCCFRPQKWLWRGSGTWEGKEADHLDI